MSFLVQHVIPHDHHLRKMEPLLEDHPILEDTELPMCFACGVDLEAGDVITLVPVGPGPDTTEQKRASSHQWFAACAVPVHWVCATGEEP